jgi:hypothetical protein
MATANGKTKATPTAVTLTCPECGKTFTRAAALGAHRRMTHGVVGTSANATANRQTTSSRSRRRATTSSASNGRARRSTRAAAAPSTSVDRDALLRMLFPNGIPPREELIGQLNNWLNEAERLARSR